MDIKEIKNQIQVSLKIVADERDKLRLLHEELEDVLSNFDDSILSLNDGVSCLEEGIDKLSEIM